ncbi:hypothetical protein EVAR_95411_1 [Eumeta japonica]|uniref:Uncharacterized protein n=1 Tax=Eumeta variegata TaxID=151549 RepID=A0A4C1VIU8_EUMVA|nr:hypothetical protein EVAR_95411_1 [Eumeta japonica]
MFCRKKKLGHDIISAGTADECPSVIEAPAQGDEKSTMRFLSTGVRHNSVDYFLVSGFHEELLRVKTDTILVTSTTSVKSELGASVKNTSFFLYIKI